MRTTRFEFDDLKEARNYIILRVFGTLFLIIGCIFAFSTFFSYCLDGLNLGTVGSGIVLIIVLDNVWYSIDELKNFISAYKSEKQEIEDENDRLEYEDY